MKKFAFSELYISSPKTDRMQPLKKQLLFVVLMALLLVEFVSSIFMVNHLN